MKRSTFGNFSYPASAAPSARGGFRWAPDSHRDFRSVRQLPEAIRDCFWFCKLRPIVIRYICNNSKKVKEVKKNDDVKQKLEFLMRGNRLCN
jgi:hypothetical protein